MERGLPTSTTAVRCWIEDRRVWLELSDQRMMSFPAEKFSLLANATPEELEKVTLRLQGHTLRWELLDEDILVEDIVAGRFQRPTAASTMDPWIGSALKTKRILILGESWYGPTPSLTAYMTNWCNRRQKDFLFSRIFNAGSGLNAATATTSERLGFWHSVMFDNFVNWSVGGTRSVRPSALDYGRAATTLPARLKTLTPTSVWVLGIEQGKYSLPLISHLHHVHSPHPCGYAVTRARLIDDWKKL